MHSRILYAMAKPLKKAIGAHIPMLGTGVASDAYQAAQSASMMAEQHARYLGWHLDIPWCQRAEFLELCGLRAEALNARLQSRIAANRTIYPDAF